MLTFISIAHALLCLFMIFVILLQPGKDAGMGGALGGGVATSAFGGRGAVTFLSKVTAVCAVLFFLTSLSLSFVGMKGSVTDNPSLNKSAESKTTPPAPAPAKTETTTPATAPAEAVPPAAPKTETKAP